jgi:hypothetical protein
VKAHYQQIRVKTKHMIHQWKIITLPYITSRHDFPFDSYIIIENDKDVTTIFFDHSEGVHCAFLILVIQTQKHENDSSS